MYRTATAARPASDKQVALIVRLLAEKPSWTERLNGLVWERAFDILGNQGSDDPKFVSSREASAVIDALFKVPSGSADKPQAAKPGYYVRGAEDAREVLVVVENRAKTGTYAKRLEISTGGLKTTARWEYAPGVGRTLAGLEPLTVEEAARLGHMHGVCVICARSLTDPDSVQRGIGPVCAARLA